jgi:Nucleotidyl transferase AbiEii toxin, Type IV TA system
MPPEFLSLDREERKAILDYAANELSYPAAIVEKDIWLCWALNKLFTMPNRLKMAFKGGTSLSKAFKVISRFSEDVDVTFDLANFDTDTTPLKQRSGSQIDKLTKKVRVAVKEHLQSVVLPYLKSQKECMAEIDSEDDATIWLTCNSVTERLAYVNPSIKLEFGGRNTTEPFEEIEIRPYASNLHYQEKLLFPVATAPVLSIRRTFWEKVTLLHDESRRKVFNKNADRKARHWSDVVMLSRHLNFENWCHDHAIRDSVIDIKTSLYQSSHSDYLACQKNGFQLLPQGDNLKTLEADYNAMVSSGMFGTAIISFDNIVQEIQGVQDKLNKF